MPDTGRRDLVANRWEPFVHTIAFEGFDFTGAVFKMQIRLTPDTPGTPLVDLATVTTSVEGVRLVSVTTTDSVPTSTVSIRIDELTVEGLPAADELGNNAVLAWDMQITPSGSDKFRVLEGTFTVKAGVTQ